MYFFLFISFYLCHLILLFSKLHNLSSGAATFHFTASHGSVCDQWNSWTWTWYWLGLNGSVLSFPCRCIPPWGRGERGGFLVIPPRTDRGERLHVPEVSPLRAPSSLLGRPRRQHSSPWWPLWLAAQLMATEEINGWALQAHQSETCRRLLSLCSERLKRSGGWNWIYSPVSQHKRMWQMTTVKKDTMHAPQLENTFQCVVLYSIYIYIYIYIYTVCIQLAVYRVYRSEAMAFTLSFNIGLGLVGIYI